MRFIAIRTLRPKTLNQMICLKDYLNKCLTDEMEFHDDKFQIIICEKKW
jgi:hypothetical protein